MIRPTRIISLPTFSKITLLLAALYGQAAAGAFQLGSEYSTTEIGLAGAGGAAYAQDATTNFSNPAGMVNIKNPEFVAGGTIVDSSAEFNGQACGGINTINPTTGQLINGCTLSPASANGGTTSFVPEFSYAMPITDRIYAGISMTAPFGLATDYGDDTALRYQATKSNIETIDINPGIAFKFNDQFSLGGGISAQRMNATLDSDFNLFPNTTVVQNGPGPVITTEKFTPDSTIKNTADDWGWGWNLGALYQFSPGSRIGLSYRSAVQHDLQGDSKLSGSSGTRVSSVGGVPIITTNGAYPAFKTDTSAEIELPATTTLSFYQEVNPQWAMLGSIYYTQWSSIQNLTLKNVAFINTQSTVFPPPTQGRDVTYPENFDNTWRYSLGTEYKLTDAWTLRAGGSYDQSPVNNTDRTIRLPDSNRWEGALGAGYRINQYVKLDAAYLHVWFQDNTKINQPGAGTTQYASSSIGTVDADANLYSLQATVDIV